MTGLTPKQQAFFQSYVETGSIDIAALITGLSLRKCGDNKGFYVYLLADSRTGAIFYVGKGKGRRYAAHVREWTTGKTCNADKCELIGEIIKAGGSVLAYCAADGLKERDALMLERQIIKAIGIDRLTNAVRGQTTNLDRAEVDARLALARIKPFEVWWNEKPRPEHHREIYWKIIEEFEYIASGRYARDIEPLLDRVAI